MRDDDTHTPLGAGGLYVYVNLGYRGDDRKGRVIHDMHCSDYREAYNIEFRESLYEDLKCSRGMDLKKAEQRRMSRL